MERRTTEAARLRRRRRARLTLRRRRLVWLGVIGCGALGVTAVLLTRGSNRTADSGGPVAKMRLVATRAARPLPAPVSGEAAAPLGGGILVIGGLDSAGSSASGVFRLDPRTGKLTSDGSLAGPLHDAAAAASGGRVLVFGGGAQASTDVVQAISGGGRAGAVGHLPSPRSDLAAVSVGDSAYVLGGYDGRNLARDVLMTADGRSFRTVGGLAVPVRYPAAAAHGQTIYVFGGQQAGGQTTDAIQAIDLGGGGSKVVGHLPDPLAHASAITLRGRIYVLGGAGRAGPSDRILRFHPGSGKTTSAGHLPLAVSNAAAAAAGSTGYLIGGIGSGGTALRSVVALRLHKVSPPKPPPAVSSSSGAPFSGDLLIADRGNNRLLLVDPSKRILWRYPAPGRPPPKGGFYFPDDAFFLDRGRAIISNEEGNDTIVQIAYPSGRIIWSYGHPRTPGSATGYLNQPDDAYVLPNGDVTVADAKNCRILFIGPDRRPKSQIGQTGNCQHDPPRGIAYPNGDTPLRNGDVLVSEVTGSYVDELTPSGRLVWSTHLPIAYPSDPQQLGPNLYLVADYHRPGGIYEFNRAGKILWSYHPDSGPGMLDHPSLAERLPNGLIAANDDYRHRVVIVDPKTKRIVWQYGRTDHPGTGPGLLRIPDGFDLLDPSGTTPTHPFTR